MKAMIAVVLAAGMVAGATAQPDPRTMPRLVNLTDARLGGLSAEEGMIVQIRWFAAEIAVPSEAIISATGGIDTEYRQAQFVRGLGHADPRPLRWLLESKKLKSVSLARGLTISLALAGDVSKIDPMRQFLLRDSDRERRAIAAEALGMLDAEKAKKDLQAALSDPFRYKGIPEPREEEDYYPVRRSARTALRVIDNKDLGEYSLKQRVKFAESMKSYDSYVKQHATFLKMLLDTANRVGVKA